MENHELELMLNAYFNWNKCRMHCFVGMLLALIKTGEWRNEQKEIKIKKHGRKAISYFRYGLDTLRDIVLNGKTSMKHIVSTVMDFFIFQYPSVVLE